MEKSMKKNKLVTSILTGLVVILGIVSVSEINQNTLLEKHNTNLSSQLKVTKDKLSKADKDYVDYKKENQIYLDYGSNAISQIRNYQEEENKLKALNAVTVNEKKDVQSLRRIYNSFDKKQKEIVDEQNLIKFEKALKSSEAKKAKEVREAEEVKKAEEARKAEEAKKAEETRKVQAAQEASVAQQANSPQESQSAQVDTGSIYTKDSGQIVGNRNSKIYHVPGQAGYHMSGANAIYFNTEEEAIAAGYRKSLR